MPLDATPMPSACQLHPDQTAAPGGLVDTAQRTMQAVFDAGRPLHRHRPSENQWAALRDYLEHVEMMAEGRLPDPAAAYLSAIPAGTGKSVAVAAVAGALATMPAFADVGVMIAVNRLTEAREMAARLKEHRARLCLVVGRNAEREMLALGDHAEADAAQIVVTTQAALKEALRHYADFDAAARYFYMGKRRRVILWDEALAFNRPVVLDKDAVMSLLGAMRAQSTEAAAALLQWSCALEHQPEGLCEVPNFTAMGVDFGRIEQDVDGDQAAQARALSIMAGETGCVRRCNLGVARLVTYVPELHRSLMPVLVTDASAARGVHHDGYRQMAERRPIRWLKEAEKTYGNLTVRLIPTAASRSIYAKKGSFEGRDLIDMMVGYIRRCAPEKVLVVGYKKAMTIHGVRERTIKEAIEVRLTKEEQGRFAFLPYGQHTATNDHKDVRHVVFAGLNFLPKQAAYAASGAALERPMNTSDAGDHPGEEDVRAMGRGLLRDSTLQAILRGAARIGVDGDCGVQEVVIPQSPQTGLTEGEYLGMFPGCRIETDLSLMPMRPFRGHLKRLVEAVQKRQEAGETEISGPSLYKDLSITRAAFSRLKDKPEWGVWLTRSGWRQVRLAGGVSGLRRERVGINP